jgi:hypothetical protein
MTGGMDGGGVTGGRGVKACRYANEGRGGVGGEREGSIAGDCGGDLQEQSFGLARETNCKHSSSEVPRT